MWDNEILSYVAKIHEYKGKQELYLRQKPVELERLMQLVEDKTTSHNREESEILGYRNKVFSKCLIQGGF